MPLSEQVELMKRKQRKSSMHKNPKLAAADSSAQRYFRKVNEKERGRNSQAQTMENPNFVRAPSRFPNTVKPAKLYNHLEIPKKETIEGANSSLQHEETGLLPIRKERLPLIAQSTNHSNKMLKGEEDLEVPASRGSVGDLAQRFKASTRPSVLVTESVLSGKLGRTITSAQHGEGRDNCENIQGVRGLPEILNSNDRLNPQASGSALDKKSSGYAREKSQS